MTLPDSQAAHPQALIGAHLLRTRDIASLLLPVGAPAPGLADIAEAIGGQAGRCSPSDFEAMLRSAYGASSQSGPADFPSLFGQACNPAKRAGFLIQCAASARDAALESRGGEASVPKLEYAFCVCDAASCDELTQAREERSACIYSEERASEAAAFLAKRALELLDEPIDSFDFASQLAERIAIFDCDKPLLDLMSKANNLKGLPQTFALCSAGEDADPGKEFVDVPAFQWSRVHDCAGYAPEPALAMAIFLAWALPSRARAWSLCLGIADRMGQAALVLNEMLDARVHPEDHPWNDEEAQWARHAASVAEKAALELSATPAHFTPTRSRSI